MRIRHLTFVVASTTIAGLPCAAVPFAHASQLAAAPTGMTSGRLWPTVVAALALLGALIGAFAYAQSARHKRRGTKGSGLVALGLGLAGVVGGAALSITADGGPGTGNGIVASWAAMVLGVIGVLLGRQVLAKCRRTGHAT